VTGGRGRLLDAADALRSPGLRSDDELLAVGRGAELGRPEPTPVAGFLPFESALLFIVRVEKREKGSFPCSRGEPFFKGLGPCTYAR
jgi:hypothetical protein